ncbi:MAG TPA: hypothetical protein ENH89_18695, partial [Aurantimonas coralicida]|nr:hypothetical protein [Aurantimonas coralicida]
MSLPQLIIQVAGETLQVGFFSPLATGEANDGTNVGGGAEVFRDKTGALLNFRTLVGAGGVGAVVNGNTVEIDDNTTVAALDAHIADAANPHATDLGNLGAGVLSELNAAVTDATLDDSAAPRTPLAHGASHADGASDEIDVANLGSLSAAGADLAPLSDGAGGVSWGDPPTAAHASAHQNGGSDEVATVTPGANAIPKATGAAALAAGWTSEAAVTQHEGAIDHNALTNHDITQHRIINDAGTSTIETWSASRVDAEISAVIAGVDVKAGVDTSTCDLGNITLSGEQTLNGLLTSASRVLVVEQGAPAQNGIYVSAAGAWSRATDADDDAEVTNGNITHVLNAGSTKFKYKYILVTPDPIIVGTTSQAWEEHRDIIFGTIPGTAAEGSDARIPTQDENDALQ